MRLPLCQPSHNDKNTLLTHYSAESREPGWLRQPTNNHRAPLNSLLPGVPQHRAHIHSHTSNSLLLSIAVLAFFFLHSRVVLQHWYCEVTCTMVLVTIFLPSIHQLRSVSRTVCQKLTIMCHWKDTPPARGIIVKCNCGFKVRDYSLLISCINLEWQEGKIVRSTVGLVNR